MLYRQFKRMLGLLIIVSAAIGLSGEARAHSTGESYVYLNITETSLSGRFEIPFQELDKAISLDVDGNGTISKDEFDSNAQQVYEYLQPRLVFYDGDVAHPVEVTGHQFFDGAGFDIFVQVQFDVPSLNRPPETLEADYRFLFDGVDRNHRGLLLIESNTRAGIVENEAQHSLIFGEERRRQSFNVDGVSGWVIFGRFVGEGIYHIVPIGYDHILFLLSLLLASVMVVRSGKWTPAPSFREPFWFVVKVVTLFTVAHTITLTLAALGIVRLPVMLVEAVIALSIAIAAFNNLYPFIANKTWSIVFILGLFHGFGFANVLDPLGAQGHSLLAALSGFNIGVEIGQLIVVMAAFPLLYLIRRLPVYKPVVLQAGSVAMIAVAGLWFVERTFDVMGPIHEPIKSALGL
ncbi:MAG: HupE/UreJ family protein [Pseudomonadota bacterium]